MPQRLTFNGPFGVSAVALAIMLVIVLVNLPSVGAAVFGAGAGDEEPADVLARMVALYDKDVDVYESRFNGRSLFFKPPPKKRPPAPTPTTARPAPTPRDTTPKPPPGPPPPPPTYSGPSPIGILGDEAWFKPPRAGEDVLRIRVGEEKDGIELLGTDPPWSIHVRYNRGEYTVTLFERTTDSFFGGQRRTGTAPPGLISAETPDGDATPGALPTEPPSKPAAETARDPRPATPEATASTDAAREDGFDAAPVAAAASKPLNATEQRMAAQRRIEEERLARERQKKLDAARAVEEKAARAKAEDARDEVVDEDSEDEPIDDEIDYPDDEDPDPDETDGGNGGGTPSTPQ